MSSIRYRRPPIIERRYERTPSYSTIPRDIHVSFYHNNYHRSKILYLNKFNAMEKLIEAAHELYPSNGVYRLFSDSTIGAQNELNDSVQVMECVQNPDHILPHLHIRLEDYRPRSISRNYHEVNVPIIRTPSQHSIHQSVRFNDNKRHHHHHHHDSIRNFVHHDTPCRNCFRIIVGSRYHCLQCPDYDICGDCEKDLVHYEHALLRIVTPRVTSIPDYVTVNAPSYIFPEHRYDIKREHYHWF
ncbi:ZZ-type domain-containing protein [Caenorhabditis elegans]|uniref:ZZ-type domain-containing protein n=1 Tax=Caenorhabditis elegans TaxID=6239 RepID=Q9N3Z0_CAEEL|nr:ZZ-type domain-containing protein [Caenorhabditis elegans]CCD71160.1 ZZ-type domain-containing protein [Caenorhabditis elegans]|eukprot:NP_501171.2 SeQueSTosome related [Caenorhabditis elegans]